MLSSTPSHPRVLHQAHLICQQCGHGPANLMVGFRFGSRTQQNEEEPVGETTDVPSSPLLAGLCFFQEGPRCYGHAWDSGWASVVSCCHPEGRPP